MKILASQFDYVSMFFMEQSKNPHAQALGRMGKGVKKTITPALIRRNKRAAKFPRPSRRKENQPK